jgi:hypothetical protein
MSPTSPQSTEQLDRERERWHDSQLPGEVFFMEMDVEPAAADGQQEPRRQEQEPRQTLAERLTAQVETEESLLLHGGLMRMQTGLQ